MRRSRTPKSLQRRSPPAGPTVASRKTSLTATRTSHRIRDAQPGFSIPSRWTQRPYAASPRTRQRLGQQSIEATDSRPTRNSTGFLLRISRFGRVAADLTPESIPVLRPHRHCKLLRPAGTARPPVIFHPARRPKLAPRLLDQQVRSEESLASMRIQAALSMTESSSSKAQVFKLRRSAAPMGQQPPACQLRVGGTERTMPSGS